MRARGFAALAALWGLAAMALLALALVAMARTDTRRAAHALAQARADAVAEGLLHRAAFALLTGQSPLPPDGTVIEGTHLGLATRLSAQDVRGLIDLNAAPPEVMERRLEAEPDLQAAPRARLLEAWGKQRGHFTEPGQFATLPGMSPDLYARIAPDLTLSGAATIDPWRAPPPVLAAATGAPPDVIDRFLADRARDPATPLPPDFPREGLDASDGRRLWLRATARDPAGAVAEHAALLTLDPGGTPPYRFAAWQ